METTFATIAGIVLGMLFTFVKLPIPAPSYLPGVMGIVGLYIGGKAGVYIISMFH